MSDRWTGHLEIRLARLHLVNPRELLVRLSQAANREMTLVSKRVSARAAVPAAWFHRRRPAAIEEEAEAVALRFARTRPAVEPLPQQRHRRRPRAGPRGRRATRSGRRQGR